MKAVLMSIQPKWVEKIAIGEKTIEVRKTKPKLETAFKVYIYATKPNKNFDFGLCRDKWGMGVTNKINYETAKRMGFELLSGKVIGEFVCDKIDSYVGRDDNKDYWDLSVEEWEELKKKSCLTIPQILEYTGDCCRCYGWHISDLKIYDKPKELSEFTPICRLRKDLCKVCCSYEEAFGGCCRTLTRPPQSWCYVEGLK